MKSNLNPPLTFTPEAQADWWDILQYTIEQWGESQAVSYNDALNQAFKRLQENPRIGSPREDILPNYRSLVVEKHVIIYWLTDEAIIIIRILHQSRDLFVNF